MAKTTKRVKPIQSTQKFNQGDTVNSITLKGATHLADVEIDRHGDVTITIKQDNRKADKALVTELDKRLTELDKRLTEFEERFPKRPPLEGGFLVKPEPISKEE